MNTLTFIEFITEFDDTMMRRHGGEEVLFLMDNAPSQKLEEDVVLQYTRIAFLPPSTTLTAHVTSSIITQSWQPEFNWTWSSMGEKYASVSTKLSWCVRKPGIINSVTADGEDQSSQLKKPFKLFSAMTLMK